MHLAPLLVVTCSTSTAVNHPKEILNPFSDIYGVCRAPEEIESVRHKHVGTLYRTHNAAFEHDPVVNYVEDTPDSQTVPGFVKKAFEVYWKLAIHVWLRRRFIALTINDGEAFVLANPPANGESSRGPIVKLLDFLLSGFTKGLVIFRSKEQRKRGNEFNKKATELAERLLGQKKGDMFYIAGIATAPASQGRGYGGRLLDAVTEKADLQSKASWLVSSNINNTAFYNEHGFQTIGVLKLGDSNPTWKGEPIVVSLMVREARAFRSVDEKV